jgi:hypothetical protein
MPVGLSNLAGFLLPRVARRKGTARLAEICADGDGCVRRRCADCGRHFASSIEQRDSYWCPYCGVQRPWECWFTPVQKKYLDDALAEDVLSAAYNEMEHELFVLALNSEGVIVSSPQRHQRSARPPLQEPTDDLTRVPVPCHPAAWLKLEPGWPHGGRCHLCGTGAQGTRTPLGRLRLRRRPE